MPDDSLTIEEALDIFLPRTQCLALVRTLYDKLCESTHKAVHARSERTRDRHGARVDAFLAACRQSHKPTKVSLFEKAFPREAGERHFIDATRLLRTLLIDAAIRSRLPHVASAGTSAGTVIPTLEQLACTLRATKPIKATAEKTIGHPQFCQAILRHGWFKQDIVEALARRGYDEEEAKRYVRRFTKTGCFESGK